MKNVRITEYSYLLFLCLIGPYDVCLYYVSGVFGVRRGVYLRLYTSYAESCGWAPVYKVAS